MQAKLSVIDSSSSLYKLENLSFLNDYYIISSIGTRKLMASPEVVGMDAYRAMVPATMTALKYLKGKDSRSLNRVNILTILRGGLNYPVEECCHDCGITVSDISFLSCERVKKDGVITGLDVKYKKLHTEPDATIVIGDIIASGETLSFCLDYVIDQFKAAGHNIRKIVFFTVGGSKAIGLMENFTAKIREQWNSFEGFECIFYEGMFTVREDNGVTGENTPNVDFGWRGGVISPEFREYVMDYEYAPALMEKCIIYDGGARRYSIGEHVCEVMDYWEKLKKVSGKVAMVDFMEEKFGYKPGVSYSDWLSALNYPQDWKLECLYEKEKKYATDILSKPLSQICEDRLAKLKNDFSEYI